MDFDALWLRLVAAERADAAPLRHAAFRRAFVARTVSAAGSWMQTVAAGWLAYEVTGSATAVGVLTLLSRAPGALAAYSGTLVDRFEPRRLAAVLFAAQVIPPAALAVLAWDGLGTIGVLYALVLVSGIGGALAVPVFPALIPGTVPPELLGKANGLSSLGFSIASLVGPLIGGTLVTAVGPGLCFALNAVSYAIIAVAVLTLPAVPRRPPKARGLRPALEIARPGTRYFRILLSLTLFALLVGPVQELAPVIAKEEADGAHILGYLLAALASGGLVGNFLTGRPDTKVPRRLRISGLEALVFAVTLVLLAVSGGLFLALLAMFFLGMAWEAAFTQKLTWMQHDSPTRLTGRMLGLLFACFFVALSLGALLIGWIFDTIGVEAGLLICAATVGVFGVYSLLESRRAVDDPVPQEAG